MCICVCVSLNLKPQIQVNSAWEAVYAGDQKEVSIASGSFCLTLVEDATCACLKIGK